MDLDALLNPRCPEHSVMPLDCPICERARRPEPSAEQRWWMERLFAYRNGGRFVRQNDHDPEDGTLYWEPRDD